MATINDDVIVEAQQTDGSPIYVYLPQASFERKGVAAFAPEDFIIDPNGVVHILRSMTSSGGGYVDLTSIDEAIEELQENVSKKLDINVDSQQTLALEEISRLQTLFGIAAPSDSVPLMDGAGNPGSATTYSRSDHQHPSDNRKANQTALDQLSSIVDQLTGGTSGGLQASFTEIDGRLETLENAKAAYEAANGWIANVNAAIANAQAAIATLQEAVSEVPDLNLTDAQMAAINSGITSTMVGNLSNMVTTNTNQTISGKKTFTSEAVYIKSTSLSRGTNPSTKETKRLGFKDKDNNTLAELYYQKEENGNSLVRVVLFPDGTYSAIELIKDSSGRYATAPATPTNANANQIATAGWVNSKINTAVANIDIPDIEMPNLDPYAKKNANNTWSGSQNFTGATLTAATPGSSSGNTVVATKGYVDTQIGNLSIPSTANMVTTNTTQTISAAKTFSSSVTISGTLYI